MRKATLHYSDEPGSILPDTELQARWALVSERNECVRLVGTWLPLGSCSSVHLSSQGMELNAGCGGPCKELGRRSLLEERFLHLPFCQSAARVKGLGESKNQGSNLPDLSVLGWELLSFSNGHSESSKPFLNQVLPLLHLGSLRSPL